MPAGPPDAPAALRAITGRVFIINRYFYPDESATAQIAADLALYLANQRVRVIGISSRAVYDDPAGLLPAHETIGTLQIDRLATTRFGRASLPGRMIDYLSFYALALVYLTRHLRRGDIVICKTDPPMLSVIGAVAAGLRGAKLINWLQDVFPEIAVRLGVVRLPTLVVGVLRRVRNWSLKSAAANVVIGQRMRDHLLGEHINAEHIHVIPNWSREVVQPVAAARQTLRAEWGYTSDDLVVGYSGNLGRGHDYQVVLDAAAALAAHPRIRFLMVGGGAAMVVCREQVALLGLSNVQFQPYQPVERLAETLSVPDIHWVTLKPDLEGLLLPSKIYGIAAVARPFIFIGAPDGEQAVLVRQWDAGFAVTPDDSAGLVAFLTAIDADRAGLQAMGDNARTMLDAFSSATALAQWGALLAAIAAR